MSRHLRKIADSKWFHKVVIGAILVAAVTVGLETYPEVMARHSGLLHLLDQLILWVFVTELVVKFGALGKRWPTFFRDGWNVFDLLIVVICFVPINAQFVAVFRLARILRVLKLITALPRLQLIVGALLKSIPSIGYVGVLLSLHFYVFAVLATSLFGGNDPFRFGDLQKTSLTLFQIVTMENWVELMHTQMYGCDKFGYDDAIKHLCTAPEEAPIAAPAFFIIFIVFGTMIILNLFIGVIMKGMEEMQAEVDEARAKKADVDGKVDLEGELARIAGELADLSARIRRKGA